MFSINPADLTVRTNAVMRDVLGDHHRVTNYTCHPLYDQETFDYDIALLQVRKTTLAVMTFCNVNKLVNGTQTSNRLTKTLK